MAKIVIPLKAGCFCPDHRFFVRIKILCNFLNVISDDFCRTTRNYNVKICINCFKCILNGASKLFYSAENYFFFANQRTGVGICSKMSATSAVIV